MAADLKPLQDYVLAIEKKLAMDDATLIAYPLRVLTYQGQVDSTPVHLESSGLQS